MFKGSHDPNPCILYMFSVTIIFHSPPSYFSQMNPTLLGCIAASALLRKAAGIAFKSKRRSTLTGDIIECLGRRWERLLSTCLINSGTEYALLLLQLGADLSSISTILIFSGLLRALCINSGALPFWLSKLPFFTCSKKWKTKCSSVQKDHPGNSLRVKIISKLPIMEFCRFPVLFKLLKLWNLSPISHNSQTS